MAFDNEKSILKHFAASAATLYILKIITKVKVIKISAYVKLNISVKKWFSDETKQLMKEPSQYFFAFQKRRYCKIVCLLKFV